MERAVHIQPIGDREKLAQWRHKMKGPAFYRLGRKIIYRGDLLPVVSAFFSSLCSGFGPLLTVGDTPTE